MVNTVSSDLLEDILVKVAKKLNIQDYDVKIKPGNKKGEGYLGEITFLDLIDKNTGSSKSIIIKKAFTNEGIRDNVPIRRTFLNEINFYSNILPTLQKFAQEIGIEVFDCVPKCYLTSSEEGREYLVMDNLKEQGYELFDKKKIVTYEHMELIYKSYAKLHATSILLRLKRPEEYEKMISNIYSVMDKFMINEQFKQMFLDICKICQEKLIPGVDDDVIKEFQKYVDNCVEIYLDSVFYKGNNPVFCHGDCWSNNMLFKYSGENQLEDIKIIDWQLIKSGSATSDLSYSLYSGASKDTFDRLDELLDSYYESFSSIFRQAGENAEKLFPLSIIKEEWKRWTAFGIIMGIMIIRGKTTDDEDLIDLADIGESDFDQETVNKMLEGTKSEEFNSRVRELLIHCHEIGCL